MKRGFLFPFWLSLAACAGSGDMRKQRLQGVELHKDAQTLLGNAASCSRPATVDLAKLQAATVEGREIVTANVRPGTARYRLLQAAMHRRVVAACERVARAAGFDLVVRDGDIRAAHGLSVGSLTDAAVKDLQASP